MRGGAACSALAHQMKGRLCQEEASARVEGRGWRVGGRNEVEAEGRDPHTHARREVPSGWSPFECTCGKGFGTEKALGAHLRAHRQARQHKVREAGQGDNAKLLETIVAAYS